MTRLILASASPTRRSILENAGVSFESIPARIDEASVRESMLAEGAPPRDIAGQLAELKARKSARLHADALVLGSDQVLALKDRVFAKPSSRDDAKEQLRMLAGQTHHLYSAAVLVEAERPVWRHVGVVRMTMHALTDMEIDAYLDRAWPDVSNSVGAYHAEGLGAALFPRIEGDWFSVLGLPLLELLSYLRLRGDVSR